MTRHRALKILAGLSCLLVAAGVGCGAFGAHALRDIISPADLLIWEKAVLYQLVHGVAAFVVATSSKIEGRRASIVASVMIASSLVFSGTLYFLVLLNQRWLGMLTPLGGIGFILAWLFLASTFFNGPCDDDTRRS